MPDYYDVLGVRRDATSEEIRHAYRRLVMQYHPDRNPGDPHAAEKFKLITEAYRVLSDPVLRRQYNTSGESPVNSKGASALVKLAGYAVGLYLLVQLGAAIVGLAATVLPYVLVLAGLWFFVLKPRPKK